MSSLTINASSSRESSLEPLEASSLEVEFIIDISLEDQLEEILRRYSYPNIVLWFCGQNGLKQKALDFCTNKLINPIRNSNPKAIFYLYNLSPWGGYEKGKIEVAEKKSRTYSKIESLGCTDLKRLDAAAFFAFLRTCNAKQIDLLNRIWQRNFIWEKSKGRESEILLRDAFGSDRSIEGIKEKNVQEAYSGLQYFEGLYQILEIVKKNEGTDPLEIVFLLPNKEYEYYFDENASFKKDLDELLKIEGINRKIKVAFICFKDGEKDERYYLLGKSIGSNYKSLEILKH